MQEVKVKSNELGVAIYMENEADILAIAESELNLLISEMELFIFERVLKNANRKKKTDERPP